MKQLNHANLHFLFLLLFFPLVNQAQVKFKSFFDNITIRDVKQTDDDHDGQQDDGYISVGFTPIPDPNSAMDIIIVKTNKFGEITWSKTFGRPADFNGYTNYNY